MVALAEGDKNDYRATGESTYYSGLWVEEAGLRQKVNPRFPLRSYLGWNVSRYAMILSIFSGSLIPQKIMRVPLTTLFGASM